MAGTTVPPEDADLCDLLGSGDCLAIIAVRETAAALSLIGCVFIVGAIVLFQRYRNYAQRLILYLSIAAMLDTIPYFTGNEHPVDGPFCDFQAFWMSFFDWSVVLWVSIITFNVYLTLIRNLETERFEKYYHMVGWGFPVLPAIIPVFMDKYGPAGAWCWIAGNTTLRFALWYVPLFILIITLAIVYGMITMKVNRQANQWQGTYRPEIEEEKAQLKKHVAPLRYYPLVYLLCSVFGLINRIQNAANPAQPLFALYVLHALTAPMQGFLNAVVYAYSGGFWKQCTRKGVTRAFARHRGGGDAKEYPMAPEGLSDDPNYPDLVQDSSDEESAQYALHTQS